MKDYQFQLLLIYCKLKEGVPLMPEEKIVWEEHRKKHPMEDIPLDANDFEQRARYKQEILSWNQMLEKFDRPDLLACSNEKDEVAIPHRKLPMSLRLAVAASLTLAIVFTWWFSPPNLARSKAATSVAFAITPGYARATLWLADGHTIALDTTVRGTLPRQGNACLQMASPGVLQYRFTPGFASQKSTVWNTLETPKGGEYQLVLSDGTKVWLNAASSFSYPVAFGDSERVVRLDTGEVYFEVSKLAAHQPFIVQYKGKRIEVLGTHFNVNAYNDLLVATLVEGAIRVTDGKKKKLLRPGQQAVMNEKGITVAPADKMQDIIAWKYKFFSFHNTRLSVIMEQVKKWYNVEVVYAGPVNDERFMVNDFPRSEPLKALLDHLEASRLVHFKVEGRKIIVRK